MTEVTQAFFVHTVAVWVQLMWWICLLANETACDAVKSVWHKRVVDVIWRNSVDCKAKNYWYYEGCTKF